MLKIILTLGFIFFWLAFLIPLHFPPWMSWHGEAFAFASCITIAWFGFIHTVFTHHRRKFSIPLASLIPVGIFLFSLAQYYFGVIHFIGNIFVISAYVALCVMSITVGFNLGEPLERGLIADSAKNPLQSLAWMFVFIAVLSVAIEGCQTFELAGNSQWISQISGIRRPGANLAQPNQLATLILMAIGSAIFLNATHQLGFWTTACLLVYLSLGLAVTESRTGLIGLFFVFAWWYARQPTARSVSARRGGVGLFGLGAAIFFAWPMLFNAIFQMSDGAIASRFADTNDSRFEIWPQLLKASLQKPWFGWGVNQTSFAQNALADQYIASAPFTYSHNIIIDLLVWLGIPAGALITLIVVVWIYKKMKAVDNIQSWYAVTIIIPVAVHSMFEYPFAYAYFLMPCAFAVGFLERNMIHKVLIKVPRAMVGSLLFVFSVFFVWSASDYLKADADYRTVRFELLNIGATPIGYKPPQLFVLTQLNGLLESLRIKIDMAMSAEDLELLKNVALQFPLATTQYRYALALQLNGASEESKRQMVVMHRLQGEINYLNFCKRFVTESDAHSIPTSLQCRMDTRTFKALPGRHQLVD